MSESVGQALEQALAYHRAPGMLPAAHGRPLPEGMITLLRLAGGDQALLAQCVESCGEAGPEVVAAAVFFIQQVMFANGSDSYRVLGVNPDEHDARIKEHYRWLVRWLHPDRNTDDWDSVYADRVNVAWQTLRLPDRRRDYDLARAQEPAPADGDDGSGYAVERSLRAGSPRMAGAEPALLSARTVQRLPVIVLGSLAGLAVALLLLMWLSRDQGLARAPDMATMTLPPEAQPAARPEPEPERALPDEVMPVVGAAETPAQAPALDPPAPAPAPRATAVARAAAPVPTLESPPRAAPPAAAAAIQARDVPAVRTQPAPPVAASVAVAALPEPIQPPTAAPGAITEAQARVVLSRFSQAYRNGDINGLMRLFASDARNNRGGRDAIVYDYQSLFSSTQARELRLTSSGWMPRDSGATVLANYEASVQVAGRRSSSVTRGEIRFDLRMENGEPRISMVRHDTDG